MKTTVSVFLSFVFFGNVFPQDIRVTVKNANGEALPFSFVFVNDDPAGVTDSLGVFWLKPDQVVPGDSIFIHNAGVDPVGKIFDEEARRNSSVSFSIQDIYASVQLDEVKARGHDMEYFFRRHTKDVMNPWQNGVLSALFEAEVTKPGQPPRRITGTFTVKNEIVGRNLERAHQFGYFHHPVQLVTASDTAGYSRLLDLHVHEALRGGTNELSGVFMSRHGRNQVRKRYNMHFSVAGREDGIIKFRLSFSSKSDSTFAFQSLLYIDEQERSLVHSDSRAIADINRPCKTFQFITDHQYYRRKKNSPPMLLPRNIAYVCEFWDGDRIQIDIKEIAFAVE